MSQCASCGSEVTTGAQFCTTCGAAVSDVPGGSQGPRRPSAETIATQEQRLMVLLRQATLGEYEVMAEIGRGGMAVVYLAHDLALDRKVAIKVMAPTLMLMDKGIQERFKREARTAAALSHPNIIPVFAVKEAQDLVYFVMKYIVGRSLESVIKEVGPLPIPVVQTVLSQVGAALGYAHRRGTVHRDMKPGNVMLDEEGWVVVTDFGIAKVAQGEALTVTGGVVGTPAYMSPEQCAGGEITGAADQYSLGVMAYEMVTGRQPFKNGTLVNLIYDHCHTPPPPLLDIRPDCPEEIAAAVMRMLEKNPADRWPTIEDAVAAIGVATESQSDEVKTQILTLVQQSSTDSLLDKFRTPGSPVPMSSAALGRGAPRPRTAVLAPARPRPVIPKAVWGVAAVALLAVAGWLVLGRRSPPAPVTMQAPPRTVARLELAPLSTSLAPGERARFRATARDLDDRVIPEATVSWESADPEVATVSPEGVVMAAAPGTTVLAVRSGASSATAVVTVSPRASRPPGGTPLAARVAHLTVEPAGTALTIGEITHLRAVAQDQGGNAVTGPAIRWTTSDPRVAQVSPDGLVTAVAVGTARIEAAVGAQRAVASVSVTAAAVAGVELSPPRGSLPVGGSLQLRAALRDRSGTALPDRAVSWESSDPQTAAVSAAGLVTGVRPGTVTITAVSGAASGTATLAVEAPLATRPADPRPEIERVIEVYRRAIESRDLAQLKVAYPGLTGQQEQAWRNFFGSVSDLTAVWRIQDLETSGQGAQARIAGTYEYRAGRRQTQNVELVVVLERGASGWRIVTIR